MQRLLLSDYLFVIILKISESRSLQQDENKCYHAGKAYDIGTEIPAGETPTCLVHCRCTKEGTINE